MTGAVDAGVAHGAGGVMGTAWGTIEVVGAAQGTTEVGEAGGDEAVRCLVVRAPGSIPWSV
jgi:hypothetical protein